MAPRVQGKIIETEAGTRYLIVEQQGRNVWRGRCKSITEAVDKNEAGIGVDKTLVDRAINHGVKVVMVTIEEQRRIFLAPIDMFNDPVVTKTRANYQGRATRILGYENYVQKYLGPNLKKVRNSQLAKPKAHC